MKSLKSTQIRLSPSGEVEIASAYWSDKRSNLEIGTLSSNGVCDNTSKCSNTTNTSSCQNYDNCTGSSNKSRCDTRDPK